MWSSVGGEAGVHQELGSPGHYEAREQNRSCPDLSSVCIFALSYPLIICKRLPKQPSPVLALYRFLWE